MKKHTSLKSFKPGIYCPSAKIRYGVEEEAKIAARRGMLESRDGARLSCYNCQWCEGWHLTSRIDNDFNGGRRKK